MGRTDEPFVDYGLIRDVDEAEEEGVISAEVFGDEELEFRHLSELERRMRAFDEAEVYIAIKAFIGHHRETVIRTLEYLQKKEGEKNERTEDIGQGTEGRSAEENFVCEADD